MSEKQAGRLRKAKEAEKKEQKSKLNKGKIVYNIIAAAVIIAVAGLGGYAVYDKTGGFGKSTQTTTTISDIAESSEMSADELLEKCGMTDLGLTGKSSSDDFYSSLTIDSYAKFTDTTADELKSKYGLEALSDDTNWNDAQDQIKMGKIAEDQGQSFEEFAEANGFPAEITADMTSAEAIEILTSQQSDAEAE